MSKGKIGAIVAAVLVVMLGGVCVAKYNRLVTLDQATQAQWAQVENAYQRRADLIPNLVETVKGAAAFERGTIIAVTEARSRVGQVTPPGNGPPSPAELQKYQQAQDQLGASLSRLLVVAEAYPNLTATQNFRDLQAQLEGTENRISVERMRFNEAARDFNTTRASFPTSVIGGLFGGRFQEKAYFAAKPAASEPPRVSF